MSMYVMLLLWGVYIYGADTNSLTKGYLELTDDIEKIPLFRRIQSLPKEVQQKIIQYCVEQQPSNIQEHEILSHNNTIFTHFVMGRYLIGRESYSLNIYDIETTKSGGSAHNLDKWCQSIVDAVEGTVLITTDLCTRYYKTNCCTLNIADFLLKKSDSCSELVFDGHFLLHPTLPYGGYVKSYVKSNDVEDIKFLVYENTTLNQKRLLTLPLYGISVARPRCGDVDALILWHPFELKFLCYYFCQKFIEYDIKSGNQIRSFPAHCTFVNYTKLAYIDGGKSLISIYQSKLYILHADSKEPQECVFNDNNTMKVSEILGVNKCGDQLLLDVQDKGVRCVSMFDIIRRTMMPIFSVQNTASVLFDAHTGMIGIVYNKDQKKCCSRFNMCTVLCNTVKSDFSLKHLMAHYAKIYAKTDADKKLLADKNNVALFEYSQYW